MAVTLFSSCLEFLSVSHSPVPDQVKDLEIKVKPDVPSVILMWESPQNIRAEDVTEHHIRFKPQLSCNAFQQLSVNGHHREITLGRDRLKPLTEYDFEVRAVTSDGAGPWTPVTKYFCKDTPPALFPSSPLSPTKIYYFFGRVRTPHSQLGPFCVES